MTIRFQYYYIPYYWDSDYPGVGITDGNDKYYGEWGSGGGGSDTGALVPASGSNAVLFTDTDTYDGDDDGQLPPGFGSVQFTTEYTPFIPARINRTGGAIGGDWFPWWLGPTQIDTLWDGSNFTSLNDAPIALNDQNQVAIDGTAQNEGYLWEPGGATSVLAKSGVPSKLQGDIFNVQPFSISNQLNPGTDQTIHILATAQNREDSPPYSASPPTEYFLWTRDNSKNWTYAKIQLPAGVSVNHWNSINNNGLIVATGTAAGGTVQHALLLVPEDIIQVDAFIPQTWVQEPPSPYHPFTSYIDNGNSRKNPLDASLTSGSSLFIQTSPEFKVRQTMDVCAFPNYDPDGSQEQATKKTTVGETRQYRASVLVSGEIPAGAAPTATGTATPYVDNAYVYHPSAKSVLADLGMNISNPLVFGSSLGPIQYYLFVTIDRSDPSHPTYTIEGTSSEFPAYEVYINGQLVYSYDPIPGGHGPLSLLLGPENTIETTGTLSH